MTTDDGARIHVATEVEQHPVRAAEVASTAHPLGGSGQHAPLDAIDPDGAELGPGGCGGCGGCGAGHRQPRDDGDAEPPIAGNYDGRPGRTAISVRRESLATSGARP